MNIFAFEFGYDWPWTYGHLAIAAVCIVITFLAWLRDWSGWIRAVSIPIAVWGIVGFAIVQWAWRINLPAELPTENFFVDGAGLVLDAGAGSGRSSLMVLLARPNARVVALDLYSGCCGISDNTPERLLENARIAGVDDRIEARVGDMRNLPFADASLDAAVSAYAIDHMGPESIEQSLAEIARVLRRGRQFLLMIINNDTWLRIAYPILIPHGTFDAEGNIGLWSGALAKAGFAINEVGTRPGTLYMLTTKQR